MTEGFFDKELKYRDEDGPGEAFMRMTFMNKTNAFGFDDMLGKLGEENKYQVDSTLQKISGGNFRRTEAYFNQ